MGFLNIFISQYTKKGNNNGSGVLPNSPIT